MGRYNSLDFALISSLHVDINKCCSITQPHSEDVNAYTKKTSLITLSNIKIFFVLLTVFQPFLGNFEELI